MLNTIARSRWLLAVLSAAIAVSAYFALRAGGPLYIEADGRVTFTDSLQSSGSDDSMILTTSYLLFTAFLFVCSWWPSKLEPLKTGIFLGCWLLQIPMCPMEVGSYSETVSSGLNPEFTLFLILFWVVPFLVGLRATALLAARPNLAIPGDRDPRERGSRPLNSNR